MSWQAVTEAFEKAIALPAGERGGFLRTHYTDDVLREAESLLRAYEESGDFLEQSALSQPAENLVGKRLGAFQVTRPIGEGGMGEVFEAERADGQFRQRVAIKIVREDWVDHRRHDRFRAERQILSDLSHPYIARLLDGGTTPGGAPYLVMELIEGEPIDRYCVNLPAQARLELFRKVCEAVDYANQRNVIHCDIKPGNILVRSDGTPKLLDFGIARLLSTDPETTIGLGRAATPEYASPEQMQGKRLTAAADVHALGVVLSKIVPKGSLAAVVARATQEDPSKRYSSAAVLAEATRNQTRRNFLIAGAAAALAGAGVVGWRQWSRSTLLTHNDALAVMRIENRTGGKELDWADRGIADLLATNFAQAGGFEVISTGRSRELLDRYKNDQRQAAQATGAAFYVTGDLLKTGMGLRLDLRLEQTSNGRIQFAEHVDADSAQALVALADQASLAILTQLRLGQAAIPSAGKALSDNPQALRLYEEGCDALERWQIPRAREGFLGAIKLDPKFAMAYFRLALTKPWNPPAALRDIGQAAELASQLNLPTRDRQMLDAARLVTSGLKTEGASLLQTVARQYPRDLNVRMALVDAFGQEDPQSAWKWSQELLAIDPGWRGSLAASAYAATAVGRFDDALAFADRYSAKLQAGDWNGHDIRGDVLSSAERFDEAIAAYEKGHRASKIGMASIHRGDFDRAEALFQDFATKNLAPVSAGGVLGFLGDVQVARGDLEGARPWFEKGVRAYGDFAWFGGMVLWKAAQVYLEQRRPEPVLDLEPSHPWSPGVRAVALFALGRAVEADVALAAARKSIDAILGDYMGARYEELYRILGAFYHGDHEDVVRLSERAPTVLWNFFALAAGRSNLSLGRLEEARRHLGHARTTQLTFGQPGYYEAFNFLGFVLGEFYLAKLAVAQGRKEEARRKLQFVLRHGGLRLSQIEDARALGRTL